jgi:hypothetical protein
MIRFTRATTIVTALGALAFAGGANRLLGQRVSQLPGKGPKIAGISCDAMEGSRLHIHQHLTILDHGVSMPIPLDVGRPASGQCLYWIHTHTPDGVIHIESPTNRTFILGDFFAIWGQPLTETRAATAVARGNKIKAWVDGKPYTGDLAKIPLLAHTDIVLEIGPPFPPPPKFTDWTTR